MLYPPPSPSSTSHSPTPLILQQEFPPPWGLCHIVFKRTVSILASYCQCFFFGACFAKSAFNSIGSILRSLVKSVSSVCLVRGSSYSKKSKFSRNDHLLSFIALVVIFLHLLHHLLSLIVTQCITCLFFINDQKYKWKMKPNNQVNIKVKGSVFICKLFCDIKMEKFLNWNVWHTTCLKDILIM